MKNILIGVVVVLLLGLGAWYLIDMQTGSGTGAASGNEPVAIVNGEEISRADFNTLQTQIAMQQGVDPSTLDAQMQAQLQTQAADVIVSQALLRQAAARAGITATEEAVNTQLETIKTQFGSEAAYEEAIATEGITEEELRAQIQTDLATRAYLEQELDLSSVTATDAEIQRLYEEAVAGAEDAPPLTEVHEQVEAMVIQQKQQQLVAGLLADLRAEADIEMLI